MEKDTFLVFCHNEFSKRGFKKRKSMYYLNGEKDVLCGIWLKKSNFGPEYVVMYYFYVGSFASPKEYPGRFDFDLTGYIEVMSKITYKGEYFLTGGISYEQYTEQELIPYFENAFNKFILPPVQEGKTYLLMNHNHLGFPVQRDKNEILDKLSN